MNNKTKQPLMRITKRDEIPLQKSILIRIIGIISGLIVCAVVIYAMVRLNPLSVYSSMWQGAFGTAKRSWITIRDTMMLLCIGVGLAPAFKMRFWNIGAEGQVLVGGLATAAVMLYLGNSMPTWLLLIMSFIASALAGAVWGLIPAIFKARYNTNETLFTLMMNYVAIQLASFFVAIWENPYGSNTVGIINQQSKSGWFPPLFGQQYLLNVIIVLALTIGMYIYLRYSKHGYEIAVVGESQRTARYIGINIRQVIVRGMLISGAICGLAGYISVSGAAHTISVNTAGGRGFTALIVAWLAKFNTLVMILASLLIVFFEKGAIQIASQFNLNDNASRMILGIVLFFILGSEFFVNYRIVFRGKSKKEVSGE